MSWIKAKYVILLLELTLSQVGYVSYVQVVHKGLNRKRICFLLLTNIVTAVNLFCL
jgi:hypothetical protein